MEREGSSLSSYIKLITPIAIVGMLLLINGNEALASSSVSSPPTRSPFSLNLTVPLALDPLIGAISAGNTAVLKPSELAPACSSFLANTIPLYLDNKLIIEPTILLDPPLDAEIMAEEIFGPLLPIITIKNNLNNIQESVEFVNSRPKPLALYAFTKNEAFKKQILTKTSSGSVVFNDVIIQFLCDGLPFGGVGLSGLGRYHGKYSFDAFSNEKAVLHRNFFPDLDMMYPPLNESKLQILRSVYKFDYFGLLKLFMGLKKTTT